MKKIYVIFVIFYMFVGVVILNIVKPTNTDRLDISTNDSKDQIINNEIKEYEKWFYQATPSDNGKLQVYFIDIGKCSSTLIVNAGQSMFITNGSGKQVKDVEIFLNEIGIESIDYLVLNNVDKDSNEYLAGITKEINVDKIIFAENTRDIKQITSVNMKEIDIVMASKSDEFYVGDSTFEILEISDYNYISGIYSYGEIDILFVDYITIFSENKHLVNAIDNIEVLRVTNDYSTYSFSKKILKSIDPEYVIITLNKENENAISQLHELIIPYLITNEIGVITMFSDGITYEFKY